MSLDQLLIEAQRDLIAAQAERITLLCDVCECVDNFICNELAADMPTMDYCQANPEAGNILLMVRRALAAATQRAKTPTAAECEASQSGGEAVTPKGHPEQPR